MFPDRASLYVVAIEDRQYKDYKIHCEYGAAGCWTLRKYEGGFPDTHRGSASESEPVLGAGN